MKFNNILIMVTALILTIPSCKTEDVEPDNSGRVSIACTPLSFAENGGQAVLTASVASDAATDITVTLSYSGTAIQGADYTADMEVTIPSGSKTGSIIITGSDDTLTEGNETVVIEVTAVSGGSEDGEQSVELVIEDDESPTTFNVILNEILYDPSNNALDGDANGDGQYVHAEDEFLEFVNLSSQPIDLSGYKIFDTENTVTGVPNHLIPSGTIIAPGKAFVVFGGGTPTGSFGDATVQTSTSGDLNLNNAGDEMLFVNVEGDTVLRFDIEPLSNNPNESYTRNPDLTGDFEQHGDNTVRLFSPGTKIDGTPF